MIKKVAYGVLFLFYSSLLGSLAVYVSSGNSIGFLTKSFNQFVNFPIKIYGVFDKIISPPPQFIKTSKLLNRINNLEEEILVLYSISTQESKRKMILKELRSDSIFFEWDIQQDFDYSSRLFNPLLLDENNIIFHEHGGKISRIDSSGNLLWASADTIHSHHSLNLDHEGNIWSPGKYKEEDRALLTQELSFPNKRSVFYRGDLLVKWDANSGKPLFIKSLTRILIENNLEHEIKKASFKDGPFHLNDIEPILVDGENLKKGDLLLSLRNTSSIIHYRPSSNRIIRYIEGPFSYQHDVDVVNDSLLSLFNNNSINYLKSANKESTEVKEKMETVSSEVLFYNYNKKTFDKSNVKPFRENEIFMAYEGLHHWLPNGNLLVEDRDKGIIWVFKGDKVIYKNVIKSQQEGYHHMLNWTRVVE